MPRKNNQEDLEDNDKLEKERLEEEQRKEQERKEAEDKEKEQQRRKLEEQEERYRMATEKLAKLEGAFEALKNVQVNQQNQQPQWNEEQWNEFTERTGLKKETLGVIDNVFGNKLRETESRFEERVKKAEERAKLAEEKLENSEKLRSYDVYKKNYFSSKPQYSRYEKDFDEFVNEFPIEMRKDPEKLSKIFEKAEVYVRGKVGSKEMSRDIGGSHRFNDDFNDTDNDDKKIDFSKMRSHERMLLERITPAKEKEKLLQDNKHDIADGLMINSKEEFNMYKKK